MTTLWVPAALIGAILATGLTAGLLYAFGHSVMPGLATLGDVESVRGFQRIDAAIANPWMGLAFVGSPVLTGTALVLHLRDRGPALGWLIAAAVLIAATIVITGAVHLPINTAIQDAAPDFADAAALRERLETDWVTWNVVRTVTSAGSLVCLTLALLATHHPG